MGTGDPEPPLGALVARLRRRAGLTQCEAAARAGVSTAGLRDLEQGRVARPRPENLHRLATALGLSTAEAGRLLQLGAGDGDGRGRPGLRLSVLGPLALWIDGREVGLASAMQRTLLGLLAVATETPLRRDEITEVLWGAAVPDGAAGLVHSHVSRLRRRLQPAGETPILLATRGGYRLAATTEQLDVLRFRDLRARARKAAATGEHADAAVSYHDAMGLWRGQPLADSPVLHEHPAVVALRREYQETVLEFADAVANTGASTDASTFGGPRREPLAQALCALRQLTDVEPLNEAAHARLMLALAAAGEPASALQVFERLRCRLREELGTDPGPALLDTHRRVLLQKVPGIGAFPSRSGGGLFRSASCVPAQLPADPGCLVGREDEMARLDSIARCAGEEPATVVTVVLSGPVGIGKTALAVHWAHRVRDRFPDGQLYVNLRGFDPTRPPANPADEIRALLPALGVPTERIPTGTSGLDVLHRTRLAGQRVLLLIDDARDAAQVWPFIPGSPGCLVLVTSRAALPGLLVAAGARSVALDPLDPEPAYQLLCRRLGLGVPVADPAATRELAAHCDGLPLALAILAARAATRPGYPLARLAADLRTPPGMRAAFAGSEPANDLRTMLSASFRALTEPAARMLGTLARHHGSEATAEVAAALMGMPDWEARELLDELRQAHLVIERRPDRYTLIEPFRCFAAELGTPIRRS
jgi:DNA-binding SARP family transcriptional activator/DNA-binding XRE family transcriptional regulator